VSKSTRPQGFFRFTAEFIIFLATVFSRHIFVSKNSEKARSSGDEVVSKSKTAI